MLFLDLDGTILGSINALRQPMERALNAAREAGLKMAVCTGRTGRGLSHDIGTLLAPDGPHIFESGGMIVKMDGTVLHSFPFDEEVAKELADVAMEMADEYDAAAEFYTTNGIYVSKKTDDSILHAQALKIDPKDVVEADVREVVKDHELVRVQWVARPKALREALLRNPKDTTVAVASAHAIPHCLFASVTRSGIDKGTAVKIVAEEYWGVSLEDCYAVGDSTGDVPMLDVVGHPYMMGSATEELLATYPNLPDVEHDGVIKVLQELVPSLKR